MFNIRFLRVFPLAILLAASVVNNSNAQISSAAFSGATSDALTVNWGTAFSTGTVYYVRLSTEASASLPVSSGPTLSAFYSFSGLAANTTYYGYVSITSSSGYVLTGSGSTLAVAPSSAAFAGVAYSSAALSWSGGSNPAWTTYEYALSVSSSFGSIAASATGVATTGWLTGLAEGTAYYGRVRATNNEGISTAYAYPSASGVTLVQASTSGVISAAAFSGATSGAVTVNWGTTFSSGTLYYVRLSTVASASVPVLSTISINTSYGFSGLSANTTYYGYASTTSAAGYVLTGFGSTLAVAPSSAAFAGVGYSSASLSWSGGINPAWTLYQYELSVSSSFGSIAASATGVATTGWLTGLAEGTAYYGRVRATNNDGISTAYAYPSAAGVTLGQASTSGVISAAAFSFVDPDALKVNWGTTFSSGTLYYVALSTIASPYGAPFSSTTIDTFYYFTGLAANTAYYGYVSTSPSAGYVQVGSGSTLAVAPSSAAFAGVGYSSAALSWSGGANPAWTAYQYELSVSSSFAAILSSATDAVTTIWFTGLTEGTTHYGRVRAINNDGIATAYAYTPAGITQRSPAAISAGGFSGATSGAVTANWITTFSSGTLYYVSLSTTGSSSAAVSTGSTLNNYYNFSGLGANTTYYGYASTTSGSGYVLTGFGSTLAVAPSSAAFAGVAYSSAALSWSGGSNPSWTKYNYQLSVSSSFGSITASATGTATTGWLTGLAEGTTYYGRVRAVNNDGAATAYAYPSASGVTLVTQAGAISAAAFSGVTSGALTVNWGTTFSSGTVYSVRLSTAASAATPVASATTTASAYSFSGLSANTTYYGYASTTTGAGYVLTGFGSTLAVAPSSAAFAGVAYSSAALSWSGGSNPAWTRYQYEVSATSTFTVITASATGTATSGWLTGLAQGTTYYGRVRAVNNDGAATAYAGASGTAVTLVYASTALPTGAVSNLSGTALGISSINWTWSAGTVASADYYALYSSSGVSVATVPFTSTASYVRSGLATNAAYQLLVAGKNSNGAGPLAASATIYTLAAVPAGLAASQVFVSSASLVWTLNGNPAGTTAQIWRSVDSSTFSNVFEGAALSFTDTSLEECSAYYFKARNKNGGGLYSSYASTISFTTQASTPTPPSGLYAEALAGSRIALAWDFSPWTGVTQYKLYYDNAAGTIDYNTPYAVFSSTVSEWTTPALTAGNIYKFGLRAANRCGIEEKNTSVFASVQARGSLTGVSASIKVPQTGKKIKGNSVTVMAEIILGAVSQVASVRFQYRVLGGGAWTDIVAANSNHPNPDTADPYFVQWNADSISTNTYELRAQATDIYAVTDSTPPTITVIIGDPDYDTNETLVSGELQKEQKVDNAVTNTVQAADDGTALVTKVVIPSGAISASTVSVTLVNNPAAKPAPPQGAQDLNLSVRISLSNSQSQLSGGKTATLTLTYKDDNGDGIVDGTAVAVDQLKMYSAATVGDAWTQLASSVDKAKKLVTGVTSHFSFFAVFAGPSANLDAVSVYPVPYIPNDGKDDNGKPYSAAIADSGIIFDTLPSVVKIKIFTLSGRLVWDYDTSASTGSKQWDVKNKAGKNVASGGYIAVISSPGSKTITKKLLVVR